MTSNILSNLISVSVVIFKTIPNRNDRIPFINETER